MYALLFADAGMTGGQISALFGLWSLVGFVLEVPSGALADRIPRRHLLVAAQVIRAVGFASWILWPTFPGFALGFVLWGASGAASSGTWEALVYDELTTYGTADRYARILGRAEALSAAGALAGTALAAPLLTLGGQALVGWVSVAVCLVATVLASRLPSGAPRAHADATRPPTEPTASGAGGPSAGPEDSRSGVSAFGPEGLGAGNPSAAAKGSGAGRSPSDPSEPGYLATLRAGVREAVGNRVVGRVVLVVVVLSGATAVEEYFSLLAVGLVTSAVLPVLLLAPAVGYAVGAEVGGRLGGLSPRRLAVLVTLGVVVFAAGALVRHPLGFLALAVGFGLLSCGLVITAARLQDTVTGPRATVTSVVGVGEEVIALAVYAVFGVASGEVSLPVLVAVSVLPVLFVAVRFSRWLPAAPPRSDSLK